MNNILRAVLEKPEIGRPIRKLLWVALRITEVVNHKMSNIFWRQPYVKKLIYAGDPKRFEKTYNYLKYLKNACSYLSYKPKISVILPLYKVKPAYFKETLLSIAYQTYENWEVCIVDDCSGMAELSEIINSFAKLYPDKVKFSSNEKNSHISITSNRCLELASGDYCALLDHDDRLLPNALGEMVRYINLHDRPDVLYSDERTIDGDGVSFNTPFHKPAWSPFTHLAMNYTTHLTVYQLNLVRKVGGFRQGFEGSQDHDLMLRMTESSKKRIVHVPICLYQWRAHELSTASGVDAKPYAAIAGEKAVHQACIRRGRPAQVTFEPQTSHYRVVFDLPRDKPLISIIIPSRNCFEHLKKCLTSLFETTSYQNYEVILVDNGSDDQRCFELYQSFLSHESQRFRLVKDPRPFNFAAQNRTGVEASRGEYIVFLNNDTEIITPEWLEDLLRVAQFPEVGAVGCKLLYSDGKLQHAGILGAGRDIAVHAGINLEANHNLYCQMLNTLHEVLAVTAACLMVSRSKFFEVGGFDETYLQNGYGDVDFCLKLYSRGYSNLFNPYVKLTHHESKSRSQALEEFEKQLMIQKWGHLLVSDPFLNPNLNYGEYYNVNQSKLDLDINWNKLDVCRMPLDDQTRSLALAWLSDNRKN